MSIQWSGPEKMIQSVAVVDIDPLLNLYRPTQQKWVSSLELFAQSPKDIKNNSKVLTLALGIYLLVNYCEKNKPPIYDIDFLAQPSLEWISLKMPNAFIEKYGALNLCYKTEEHDLLEPLTDIDILITERKRMGDEKQVFTLPAAYKIVNNNPISHSFLIYKRIRNIFDQTFKPILFEKYPQKGERVNLGLLPIFCFPEGIHLSKELKGFITFNFIFTLENGQRIYATALSFKQQLPESLKIKLNLKTSNRIYYQKAICVLSKYRYTDEFAECLKHLYRLSMSKNDIPFHQVIMNFANNLEMPKEVGINGISYSYGGSNICFDTNNSYPIISERSIYCVFKFLPLQAIINIFQAILLQKNVIFVSQCKTILGYAVEAFLSFIFPFRCEGVLIPILPSSLKEYLSAPVPYIVGVHPSLIDNSVEAESIIVQMDNGCVQNDEDLPPLPEKLQKQLRKKLQPFEIYDDEGVKQYLQNPESTYIFKMQQIEHPNFHGHLVRDSFYQFMLTLMKNYKKFWKTPKYKQVKQTSSIGLTEPQLLNDIFKVQDFLSDLGMTKMGSFGYKFTEATIFTAFIERRHQYSSNPEIVFFDDSIDRKKSKKEQVLIEKIANIRYIVTKHPEPQKIKTIYVYDRFPSILGLKPISQQDIKLDLSQSGDEEIENIEQFLEHEYGLYNRFYQESISVDMLDHKIESLLIKHNKKQYQNLKESFKQKDVFASSLSKIKRIDKNKIQKLKFFQSVYLKQMDYVDTIFRDWNYASSSKLKFRQINKKMYASQLLKRQLQNSDENEVIGIYEECYGYKDLNFQILVKGSSRIIFTNNQNHTFNENLKGSRKRLKLVVYICIPHFGLKHFINKIIPEQSGDLFSFALEHMHLGISNPWTIQTLIELGARLSR